jgi:hypothetical protein
MSDTPVDDGLRHEVGDRAFFFFGLLETDVDAVLAD